MIPDARSMTMRGALFMALLAGFVLLPMAALAASAENARRLYDVSGLAEALKQLPAAFKDALNEDEALGADETVKAAAARLVDKYFAFKDLELGALTIIESGLTDAQIEELVAYLSTGVGLRATEMEKAGQQPDLADIADEEGRRIYADLLERSDPRVEIYDRMNLATKTVDATVAMSLNVTYLMLTGALSAPGQQQSYTDEEILDYVNALAPQIAESVAESAFASFAYTYQDMSLEDLGAYADFLETPAATAFYEGQTLMFRTFLMSRSQAFGHELMVLMGARRT